MVTIKVAVPIEITTSIFHICLEKFMPHQTQENRLPTILDSQLGPGLEGERPATAEEQGAVIELVRDPGFQSSLRRGIEDATTGRGTVRKVGEAPE